MTAKTPDYPWFGSIEGDEIEQGDILEGCPVFLPPNDLAATAVEKSNSATFKWEERDLIVMSQSCDLAKGREKIDDILLCAVWKRSELKTGYLAKDDGMELARKGQLPAFHVLAASNLLDFEREVRVVDFRRVYSLPVPFVRRRAGVAKRLRLLPPYREHLSQSFARFFMRVGLPIDIPSFTPKKK
jgi:hypothetical protein